MDNETGETLDPQNTEKPPESADNPSDDDFETDFDKVFLWIEDENEACEDEEADDEAL
jgi:hypothetical protein